MIVRKKTFRSKTAGKFRLLISINENIKFGRRQLRPLRYIVNLKRTVKTTKETRKSMVLLLLIVIFFSVTSFFCADLYATESHSTYVTECCHVSNYADLVL